MTADTDAKRWYTSSSGRIEIQMTLEQARIGHHQGACDDDVEWLSQVLEIAAQLEKIAPETLAKELAEYGAWGARELADHEQNLQRILWLACGDITEEETEDGKYIQLVECLREMVENFTSSDLELVAIRKRANALLAEIGGTQ